MEPPDGAPTLSHCMRSFEPYLVANKRTENPVLHISLNPHKDDRLTDDRLISMAEEYLKNLGFGNQPYIIYKHNDTDREHIHIVTTWVDEQGKKIDDYLIWKRSEVLCRKLEAKYGLHYSPKEGTPKCLLRPVDYKNGDLKRQIAGTVKAVAQQYRFQSFKEYKAVLSRFNIIAEEASGQSRGKPYQGLIYAATDEQGRRIGTAIKSSKIDRAVQFPAIVRLCSRNKTWFKTHPPTPELKATIAHALEETTRQGFLHVLNKQNIDAILWQNDSGHIYGVTYIDHNSQSVFKGSLLGKEYSASAIERRYDTPVEAGVSFGRRVESKNSEVDLAEGIFDIFSIQPSSHSSEMDPEQIEFYHPRRKKKKRGPGIF